MASLCKSVEIRVQNAKIDGACLGETTGENFVIYLDAYLLYDDLYLI